MTATRRTCAIWTAVVVFSVSACGRVSSRTISSAEYGQRWPFSFATATLECNTYKGRPLVTVTSPDDRMFGLNGAALDSDLALHHWREALSTGRTGLDVQAFIALGLKLCGE